MPATKIMVIRHAERPPDDGSIDGVQPLSTLEMRTRSSFDGFDFTSVLDLSAATDNSPQLRWIADVQ